MPTDQDDTWSALRWLLPVWTMLAAVTAAAAWATVRDWPRRRADA